MVRADVNWRELKREYTESAITLKELAREYGVRVSAVNARALKEGWVKRDAGEARLDKLKRAADMAANAVAELMSDDKQFYRHAYAEKSSGEILETTLNMGNIKQLREAIGAIRDLSDAMRSLHDLLTPREKSDMDAQRRKLELDEKKLAQCAADAERAETGVVILPDAGEDDHA